MASIRVMRNFGPKREEFPWLVICSLCAGSDEGGMFGAIMALNGRGMKGHAKDWRTAQDYATRHALAHEATRCTTCLHVPSERINDVTGVRA